MNDPVIIDNCAVVKMTRPFVHHNIYCAGCLTKNKQTTSYMGYFMSKRIVLQNFTTCCRQSINKDTLEKIKFLFNLNEDTRYY